MGFFNKAPPSPIFPPGSTQAPMPSGVPTDWQQFAILHSQLGALKGGTFHGAVVNNVGDLISVAKSIGLGPEQTHKAAIDKVLDKYIDAGAPLPSPATSGPRRDPDCRFTIALAQPITMDPPEKMLLMRLRLKEIPASKLANVHFFITPEKATVVCFKPNGEYIVLEDETALFPSDSMVASFHLLLKAS